MNFSIQQGIVPTMVSIAKSIRALISWKRKGFAVPAPRAIKNGVLRRYLNDFDFVIETGTYRGESTRILAQINSQVITIEPDLKLYNRAKKSLSKDFSNVQLVQAKSEDVLQEIISENQGSLGLFLDSHYCGPNTFMGPNVSPVLTELEIIGKHAAQLSTVTILVDDLRYFDKRFFEDNLYPPLDFLVEWCKENNFDWRIEYDIFVAIKSNS